MFNYKRVIKLVVLSCILDPQVKLKIGAVITNMGNIEDYVITTQ